MKPWWLLLPCLWLAGCATRPPLSSTVYPPAWQENARLVESWNTWELQGRIGIKMGEEGWHASLHWQQSGDHFQIRITGPFGQGGVQLEGNEEQVTFRQGERYAEAADAETLLQEALGWSLPVKGLRTWIRGLPRDSATAVAFFDDVGQLIRLHEDGWVLEYPRYMTQAGVRLPSKLRLEHRQLQIRLVVDQWRGPPTGDVPE